MRKSAYLCICVEINPKCVCETKTAEPSVYLFAPSIGLFCCQLSVYCPSKVTLYVTWDSRWDREREGRMTEEEEEEESSRAGDFFLIYILCCSEHHFVMGHPSVATYLSFFFHFSFSLRLLDMEQQPHQWSQGKSLCMCVCVWLTWIMYFVISVTVN